MVRKGVLAKAVIVSGVDKLNWPSMGDESPPTVIPGTNNKHEAPVVLVDIVYYIY